MGYLDIDNLYKNQDILMFKECYAMEKIHGTSAHILLKIRNSVVEIIFFSGGEKHENFIKLFDKDAIEAKAKELFPWPETDVFIYGEAYGAKCQGMSATYGKELKFIVFDVRVGGSWLNVPSAEDVAKHFKLEFVWYDKVSTDIESLDKVRIRFSEQAKRNGCGDDKMQEGVVLRPLIELKKNNGERIIAKYKNDAFSETRSPRKVGELPQLLQDANKIADEWVTEMRLTHVLDAHPDANIENTKEIIEAMIADVLKESKDEIVNSTDVKRSISRATAVMFKRRLQMQLKESF
jgi:hypothetical protein